jgi:hypothetical protein
MNEELLNLIQSNPEAAQAVGQAVQELMQDEDITPETIGEMIRMFEFVLQNPDSYPEFRQSAVESGAMDPEDLPEQFDANLLNIGLLALKVVQQQMQEGNMPRFARGGLNQIARMGRYGDTELAHITPFEARILQAYGGSGTINPMTGQPEFFLKKVGKSLKKVFKAVAPVLPIILSFVAPGLGTAIGSALSGGALAGSAAGMLGSAAIGGLSSAASGGNVLQGALGGALGAGAGSALGSAVGDATGIALGKTAQNVIGSSLIGGAQGAISGQGFGAGALQGATGGYLGSTLGGAASGIGGKVGAGLQTAGQQFGNALTMGATPQDALSQGALSGLAAAYAAPSAAPKKSIYDITPADTGGLGLKAPSDLAIEGLRAPATNTASFPSAGLGVDYGVNSGMTPTFRGPETMAADYSLYGQPQAPVASAQPEMGTGIQVSPLNTIAAQTAELTPGTKGTVNNAPANKGFSVGNAAAMLPLLSMFSGAQTPEEIQQVVSTMSPEQREYFSRPLRTWNWDMLDAAAKMEGIPVGNYIALNWDKVGGGAFDKPEAEEEAVPKLARGGALNRVAYLASGGGTGRSDSIDAKLSDGEYVMDAETVALIGDGSTNAGARRLDQMRSKIRQHKGKSMARGKFSANAKSPLAYLKGA